MTLAREIPAFISSQPLTKGHLLAAQALDMLGELDLREPTEVTSHEAALHIAAAFQKAVHTRLPNRAGLPDSLEAVIFFQADNLSAIITTNTMELISPAWFSRRNLSYNLKQQVYSITAAALKNVVPIGFADDLVEYICGVNYGGEETDEGAREYLVDGCGEDPDDLPPMPSEYKNAIPAWAHVTDKRDFTVMPPKLRAAAEALDQTTIDFNNAQWPWARIDFEELCEINPGYADAALEPPIWFFPRVPDLLNAVDDVMNHAMQCGVVDACSAARMNTPGDITTWLSYLDKSSALLADAQSFMDMCDDEFGPTFKDSRL